MEQTIQTNLTWVTLYFWSKTEKSWKKKEKNILDWFAAKVFSYRAQLVAFLLCFFAF